MKKKTRRTQTFLHYEGWVKVNDTWRLLGLFKTVANARKDGASKCKPRFNRA